MAKTIFLYGIKDGWLPPISFLFIYSFCYILWRPLVAGERIGKMDGWKIWKNWFEKKTQFCYQLLSVVISCYQKLLSVVIM